MNTSLKRGQGTGLRLISSCSRKNAMDHPLHLQNDAAACVKHTSDYENRLNSHPIRTVGKDTTNQNGSPKINWQCNGAEVWYFPELITVPPKILEQRYPAPMACGEATFHQQKLAPPTNGLTLSFPSIIALELEALKGTLLPRTFLTYDLVPFA